MKPHVFSSTDLNSLQRQLESWRQQQSSRSPLPARVWDAAAQLCRVHGVGRVARTLRLDFYKLRRHCGNGASGAPPVSSALEPSSFIELKLEGASGSSGGWVELFDGPDRRMRLQTGQNPEVWAALVQSFWRRGR